MQGVPYKITTSNWISCGFATKIKWTWFKEFIGKLWNHTLIV